MTNSKNTFQRESVHAYKDDFNVESDIWLEGVCVCVCKLCRVLSSSYGRVVTPEEEVYLATSDQPPLLFFS